MNEFNQPMNLLNNMDTSKSSNCKKKVTKFQALEGNRKSYIQSSKQENLRMI